MKDIYHNRFSLSDGKHSEPLNGHKGRGAYLQEGYSSFLLKLNNLTSAQSPGGCGVYIRVEFWRERAYYGYVSV